MRKRWDSLLDTLADLEGTVLERNVPSETLTVELPDFSTVEPALGAKPSHYSHSTHDSSVNSCDDPVHSGWVNEWALVGESSLLKHAEPQPSYHRPVAAV